MNRKEALKILGFGSSDNPSEREITVAYRELALKYHPDKHSDKSKDVQKQNEEKFKELDLAYKSLTQENVETKKYTKKSARSTSKDLNINSTKDLKFYLYAALLRQDIAFLKKLFSKFKISKDGKFGDYINEKHFGGDLPLFSAISSGNVELVQLLLDNGADFNVRNEYGESPLHKACSEGHGSIVELLLKCDANPNVQNGRGRSPLHRACSEGHDGIVKLLLKHNADPNMKDQEGKPPLIFAFEYRFLHKNEVRVISLLLEHGADPNVQDKYGEFLLYKACSERCDSIVRLLLEHKADPNIKDQKGKTPLSFVFKDRYLRESNAGIVELLLKYDANPDVKDQKGKSLFYYIIDGHSDIDRYKVVELLLDKGVSPNIQDDQGRAPLHYLCEHGYRKGSVEITKLLLRRGADPDLKDEDGKKPIDFVSPYSDVGKLFGAIDYNKATSLGAVTLLATAGSIALISGVADAYIGKVWCSTLAAVMAAVALCCAYYAIKTLFFSPGLSSEFTEARAEFLNSQKLLSPAGGA